MPQELRVVRCFQCLKFQVDIVKKVNKWICKVCGVKQSLIKEFFRGSGKECRAAVQELTARNIAMEQREVEISDQLVRNEIALPHLSGIVREPPHEPTSSFDSNYSSSKWDSFVAKEDEVDSADFLQLEKALVQVSSTSFDREKVNVHTTTHGDGVRNKWSSFYESVKDDSEKTVPDSESYPSSNDRRQELSKSKINEYYTHPMGSTTSSRQGVANQSQRNKGYHRTVSSTTSGYTGPLIDFHQKKPFNRALAPAVSVAKSNTECETSKANRCCSNDQIVDRMPNKRKHSNSITSPLMNFGNRSAVTANGNCTQPKLIENKMTTVAETGSHGMSSKWAKFVVQDETKADIDDVFEAFL